MWYFSWMLGLGLAAAFSILNALWFELRVHPGSDSTSHQDALTPESPMIH
jgi:cyd operon protein YbgT